MEGEQSFAQMWEDAQVRFEKTTNKSFKQAKNQRLGDVLAQLDQHFNPRDPKDGGKKARIKELVTNVLKFVQLLGGIAAQGASMVFGPANICFNALSFLMNIPAEISSFYDDLSTLFEEISNFVKQFKIYQRIEEYAKVGMELKEGTHKLMIALVDICAICIKFYGSSKLHTIKTMTKLTIFNNDSGIKSKLNDFRTLINHQSHVSDAVTLEHVLNAEHETSNSFKGVFDILNKASEDSRTLLENSQKTQDEVISTHTDVKMVKLGTEAIVNDVKERSSEKKQREEFDNICKKLSVTAESIQQWEKEFDQIRSNSLPRTGSWLKDIDIYERWANIESDTASQLLLSGSNGSGKTSLAFALLDDLRARFDAVDSVTTRVSFAFYRFSRKEKKPRDNPVKDSLKWMAVQIANSNLIFSKLLSSGLKSKDSSLLKDASLDDVLKELFPSSNSKDNPNMAFVLLFDSLDQLSDDEANQLFKAVLGLEATKVRIVMTGTDEIFQSCQNSSRKNLNFIPLIRVEEHNEADIKSFIEQDLKARKILQGDAPEVLKIVEQLRKRLPEVASGNFNNVRQIIDRVSEAIESEESEGNIDQLISEDTLRDKEAAIVRLLNELNDSLNVQEIEQLNELLAWVLYAWVSLSINQMAAVLFLRTKRALLQNLEDKIAQKYYKILRIEAGNADDQFVQVRTTDLETFFCNTKRQKRVNGDVESNDDPKISMTIKIDHVRLSKVQRFFWDLSEKIVLDKFTFATLTPVSGSSVGINANIVNSNLLIIRRCFDILLEMPTKETLILSPYAIEYLLSHLESLRENIDDVETSEKAEIVDNLITLFQSPDSFEKYLSEEFLTEGAWLHNGLTTIQDWLRDPEAAQRLNRRALSWLRQANAENCLFPLGEIAAMIARKWLCDRSWDAQYPYKWINVFVFRLEEIQAQDKVEGTESSSNGGDDSSQESRNVYTDEDFRREEDTAPTRIEQSAEWAAKTSNIVKNSLYYERLGNTYAYYGEIERAKESFLEAKTLPDSSWKVSRGLADAYGESDDISLATREMEVVFAHLRAKKGLSASEKGSFVSDLVKVARWQTKLTNASDAIAKLGEAIHLDEHFYESYFELFKILNDIKQRPEALKILEDMDKAPAAEHKDMTKLSTMLLDYTRWLGGLESLEQMLQVTKPYNTFQTILLALQKALSFAQHSNMISSAVDLHLGYGVALAHYSNEETEKRRDLALVQWKQCCLIGFKSGEWGNQYQAINAASFVFNYHFSKARASLKFSQSDTVDYNFHVKEMEDLAEEACRPQYDERPLRLSLASFYTLEGCQEKAQKLLTNELRAGIDLLSDDDPENDVMGYSTIANVLMHVGDNLNALSAWSLYGPRERHTNDEPEQASQNPNAHPEGETQDIDVKASAAGAWASPEPLPFYCDGRCNKSFTYADSLWFCKVCYNVNFCDECLWKVQTGTLPCYVCAADHEWLLVPSWVDEYKATGKGRVRVGGVFKDGKRVGGGVVGIDKWLDTVREEWGVQRKGNEEQCQGGEDK